MNPNQDQSDNETKLFDFDPYDRSMDGAFLEGSSRSPPHCWPHQELKLHNSRPTSPSIHSDLDSNNFMAHDIDEEDHVAGKGKGVSQPMPIRPQASGSAHDLFDMSPSSSRFSTSFSDPDIPFSFSPSSMCPLTPPPFDYPTCRLPGSSASNHAVPGMEGLGFHFGDGTEPLSDSVKGKGRELPHTLPPLRFSPTEFGYGATEWPLTSPTPGPSSWGSGVL